MGASDSSEHAATSYGSSPSRACPLHLRDIPAVTPRSPGSRARGSCARAELQDPGWNAAAFSASVAAASWPSAEGDCVGSIKDGRFEARSPSPRTRPPTLRLTSHLVRRKEWASRGRIPPGVGLAPVAHLLPPAGLPAHVPVGTAPQAGRPPDRTRRADFPHRAPTDRSTGLGTSARARDDRCGVPAVRSALRSVATARVSIDHVDSVVEANGATRARRSDGNDASAAAFVGTP